MDKELKALCETISNSTYSINDYALEQRIREKRNTINSFV